MPAQASRVHAELALSQQEQQLKAAMSRISIKERLCDQLQQQLQLTPSAHAQPVLHSDAPAISLGGAPSLHVVKG